MFIISVLTTKKTQHVPMIAISWLALLKEITAVHYEVLTILINKLSVRNTGTCCQNSWHTGTTGLFGAKSSAEGQMEKTGIQ
jgi:hypothetical protein